MILDTSAILALLLKEEPEASAMLNAIERTPQEPLWVTAPTYLEAFIVTYHRLGVPGLTELEHLGRELGWHIVAFDSELAILAGTGYTLFHRGKSGLNFGDCFAYALAKARNEKLLCKGHDFPHTDIALVEY